MKRLLICGFVLASSCIAQDAAVTVLKEYVVSSGVRIPLALINSVSTKHSASGDRVYLETVFPILANGKIAIPPGSFVSGTITEIKRPGRVKGRGELYLRFDTLTLANGVTRDFRARMSGVDGRGSEELDRKEGKVMTFTDADLNFTGTAGSGHYSDGGGGPAPSVKQNSKLGRRGPI
jgi:hypothetical protein